MDTIKYMGINRLAQMASWVKGLAANLAEAADTDIKALAASIEQQGYQTADDVASAIAALGLGSAAVKTVQSGSVKVGGAHGSATVVFPEAFALVPVVMLTGRDTYHSNGATDALWLKTVSATGFTLQHELSDIIYNNIENNFYVDWIAIGT